MNFVPHEYQKRAIKKLISQGSTGLFLDPGLGKTSCVLAAFKILKDKGFAKRMLVIAPKRVCIAVWPNEIRKWADFNHFKVVFLHGADKEQRLKEDADIFTINPEGLAWLLEKGRAFPTDILCIDESSKFKNTQTKRFKTLRSHLPSYKYRWILTGTPTPNGLMDLFGQAYILDLGRALGAYITHYRNSYFKTDYMGYTWTPLPNSFERIVSALNGLCLRMKAEDYLTMPEEIVADIPVTLPKEVMEQYKLMEEVFIAEFSEQKFISPNAAVAGGKCRQIANGALYDSEHSWSPIHDAKLDALEDLIEELAGAPLLVLYEFKHDWERIKARFPSAEGLTDGSEKKLEARILRFNAGEIPILVGHPASMGHGLNLQGACHHVCFYGVPWNLEHYLQAIARVKRQGQEADKVFVYRITAEGTLDTRIAKVLAQKSKTQEDLLGALALRN